MPQRKYQLYFIWYLWHLWHFSPSFQKWVEVLVILKGNSQLIEKPRNLCIFYILLGNMGASLMTQLLKNYLECGRCRLDPWVGEIPWRRKWLPTPVFLGFPYGSAGKESTCNEGRPVVQSLGWKDPLKKGKATLSSILAWRIPWTVVHGVAKSESWLCHSTALGPLR